MTKLLILSSDTGEGHNSAAAAIQAAARTAGLESLIRKPLEESGWLNRFLGKSYNALLTRKPQWMTKYLWLIDRIKPNERDFIYRYQRKFIGRFLDSTKPDILLSVHPMLNHFVQRFVKEERLGIPCYTFLTDPFPPFWRGWSSPYIDRYFVVRDEALHSLGEMNVEAWRIDRVPMPVRGDFKPATMSEIQEFRRSLALDDSSTILINGGARGGGPLFETYEAVKKAAGSSNILVVCGRNRSLKSRIENRRDPKTKCFSFVQDIHRYVAAADLVLTKPGAMSTYEALACRVPILLLGICALMPQESGMFTAATHYDFGFAADTFGELENVIRLGPRAWHDKRQGLTDFYQPDSGKMLIERIQPVHVRV